MSEPRWVSQKALLLLHHESLAEFGGMTGLRDQGLLESAFARPRNLHAYLPESTVAEMAACYAAGISQNHPFIDGNKRAAFLSIGMFLAVNGYRLNANQVDSIETMLALAGGALDEPALARWIETNSVLR